MKTVDIAEVKAKDLREVLRGDRLILTHRGVEKFTIISINDEHLFEGMQLDSLQDSNDEFHIEEIDIDS